MPRRKCIYALYEGEEMIMTGTAKELAEARGVKVESIYQYSKPSYLKRNKGNKHVAVVNLGTLKDLGESDVVYSNVYEMKKAGEVIAKGTAHELAALRGVSTTAIYEMASDRYKDKGKGNHTILEIIGKTTEMGNY